MRLFSLLTCIVVLGLPPAWAGAYHLDIARGKVNVTGGALEKITVNGGIPGPILTWRDGEDVTVTVTNHMDEDTSIHWHGILLPEEMDGVPGLNGFPGIRPGETFTYRFKIRQTGTYWYHAHSNVQEQEGVYGALIVKPKGDDPIRADRDYVVLLSDFSEEDGNRILGNLKMSSEYYQFNRRTLGDFFDDVGKYGFSAAWKNAKDWGEMRMLPTDLSDVTGYTFLMNGKPPERNWTGLFNAGEKIRLRFINASAMSIFDVRIPGLKMTVVEADGQPVEPVSIDEFRFGVAETYDVIVEPKESKAYTIAAEPIDRTGFALGTLAPREGMKGEVPEQRPRALLTMADMGMGHDMDHGEMDHGSMSPGEIELMRKNMQSGWARTGAPPGSKALEYKDLRFHAAQKDVRPPERTVEMVLGGNMERYIWTMNGRKYENAEPVRLKYGERIRIRYVNETMMAHPIHLHGMFTQLENGQPAERMPNKHTVTVPPGGSVSVILTADEPGEWAFHCHLIYHMLSGMMTTATVSRPGGEAPVMRQQPKKTEGGYRHAR